MPFTRAIAGATHLAAGEVWTAAQARVAWVPQETLLPPDLTVAEWIFLGCELHGRLGWLRQRAMHEAAEAELGLILFEFWPAPYPLSPRPN